MAENPITLWLTLLCLLPGCVPSIRCLPLEKELQLATFDCELDIKGTNWTMECESHCYASGASSNFFVAKFRGVLNPVSPLTHRDLLNSTSLDDSELYSCDSQWKYYFNIEPTILMRNCENCKKSLHKLVLALNESSLRSFKISSASTPGPALKILSECSRLKDVIITDNFLPKLSLLPARASNNSVVRLSMKENEIENVTDGIFSVFHSLKLLDLSHNLLKHVEKQLFDGLDALTELDLSYNLIESLPSDVFANLASLKNVFLRNNNLKRIHEDSFKSNNLLAVIDVSNNDLKYLPAILLNDSPNLKNFSCSNCSLLEVDKHMFLNTVNLVWMDFTYNHLRILHADMFKSLKFLNVVDLSNNNVTYLEENLFPNQQYLTYVNLTNNDISSLKTSVFAGAPNIRYLDLSRNKIKILTDDHIKNFTDLEYFGLNYNSLVRIELGIKTDVKIRRLYASNNYITKFNVKWKRLIFMESLKVDHNELTSIILPPCIPSIKQTLTFSFRHNRISRVIVDVLVADESRVKISKTLSAGCFFNGLAKNFVDLTGNPLMCDCKLYPFYEYLRKKSPRKYELEMFIDKGNLTCADPPFLRNRSLIYLPDDALSCPISEQCPSSCRCGTRGKDNLIFVDCSSINVEEIPQTAPTGTTVLYANGNNISSMISLNTRVWNNLREVHLDDNLLTNLDDWQIPPSLRYLSVSGNRLKTLPHPLMELISNVSDFQLFFGSNDQNCDCGRKTTKKFLMQYIKFVRDSEDILCVVTNNGTSELLPLVSVPERDLCPESSDSLLYSRQKRLVVALCVTFSLLIMLVLVYYKQRQLILSFFYIHCDELFRLFYFEDDDEDEKTFDAFVAYSGNDREIVLKLLQELERNPPFFRLCIHERNWMPGRFITDNIVNSVESSKRTIVVLSNTFISSPWFNIELRAAVFKMSKDKMSRIIVILTDNTISLDSVDPEIRHVISKRTYLVWGERWFWEKLWYAMPRKRGSKRRFRSDHPSDCSTSEVALMT